MRFIGVLTTPISFFRLFCIIFCNMDVLCPELILQHIMVIMSMMKTVDDYLIGKLWNG